MCIVHYDKFCAIYLIIYIYELLQPNYYLVAIPMPNPVTVSGKSVFIFACTARHEQIHRHLLGLQN